MESKKHINIALSNKQKEQDSLIRDKRAILTLAPEKALDAILEHPLAPSLIRSFSPQDIYLLINEIGLEDSIPVIAMADDSQWQFFLDSDSWDRDSLDMKGLTRWVELLFDAAPLRFTNFMAGDPSGIFNLWIDHNLDLCLLA